MKDKFLNYVHHFRGLAILLIVAVHCRTSISWPEGSIAHDVLYYGLDFSTILFVFISGFLFSYLNAERFDYGIYLKKKFLHVILPYMIVSIPALLDKLFIETNAAWMSSFYHSLSMPFKILYMLLTGKHSGSFYFIPMIAVIFLLAPLFHALQKSRWFTAITAVVVLVGMFSFNYAYFATIGESVVYFIPVYLFGIWAGKNRESILSLSNAVLYGLVGIYFLLFFLEWAGYIEVFRLKVFREPHYFDPAFNWAKLKMMVLAIILIHTFYRWRTRSFPLLHTLGNYSFGIYFLHIYFIALVGFALRYYHIQAEQNIFFFIGYMIFVVGGSMACVFVVKKIMKKNSRLIVGS